MRRLYSHWPLLLLWLLIAVFLIYSSWDRVVTRAGWDPDDQLRLVQLRDFLNGQSWFDSTQYRMNAPDGAPMHWSRLVELPLAIVVLLLSPLLGVAQAEMVAASLIPLLCLGGIAFLLAQVADRISGRAVAIAACMLALIAPAMLIQLRPMRIDHHGWQIFCAVLGFATLYWQHSRRAGLVLGVALAVWLHISLEGAPMTLGFFMLLGWRWIADGNAGARLSWALVSFAATSLLLFLGTQPAGFAANGYCDTISPAHVAAILLASAILIPACRWPPQSRIGRLLMAALAGGGALALLFWQMPVCARGAFADLDPVVRSYWYANVREGLPVWEQQWQTAVTLMTPLVAGLLALAAAWRITGAEQRPALALSGYFLIYGCLLSALVFRTVSVATAFTIVPFAICLVAIWQRYRSEPRLIIRLSLVPVVILLLAPGIIIGAAATSAESSSAKQAKAKANKACATVGSIAKLAILPKGNIAAPFNLGPTILMTTQHSVLASSHHRNRAGMRDQIDLFRLPPNSSKAIIKRRVIRYLVTCPHEAEMKQYVSRNPNGLWAQIDAGRAPDWLRYRGTMGKGLMVWEVRP
jgi:hypothetical protein